MKRLSIRSFSCLGRAGLEIIKHKVEGEKNEKVTLK